jgi:hypothetical protein
LQGEIFGTKREQLGFSLFPKPQPPQHPHAKAIFQKRGFQHVEVPKRNPSIFLTLDLL